MSSSDVEKGSAHYVEDRDIDIAEKLHIEKVRDETDVKDVARVEHVHNAAFTAAVAQSNIKIFSRDSMFLFWCVFVAFLCSCANGYDTSLMTAINAMPFYQKKFNSGYLGSTTGLIFSMYNIGGILGPWFAGPIADRWGRRAGMFVGGCVIITGSIVISTSQHKHQFLAGRFILGFGIALMTAVAPAYCIEVTPPQWRGRMTAFYNIGWYGGAIPAAGITLGTAKINSDLSWRLPLVFQCAPSLVVVFAVWFLPESPRWLVANERDAEALAFITKYHGGGDPNDTIVQLEWAEFKRSIDVNGTDKRWWDYSGLWNSHSARWRTFMMVLMSIIGQFSGSGLGYFNTEIYRAVGYGTSQIFDLNLGSSFVSAVGAAIGVSQSDRMPRRHILTIGPVLIACCLAANGALSRTWAHESAAEKNLNVGRGAVACFFLFNFVFAFTYTPLQALYPVEVQAQNTRAKGMSMHAVIVALMGFINLYCGPIALANIKYNYMFFFVGWDTLTAVIWYFLCVETTGRTLEELEEIFASPNPVAASKKMAKVAVRKSGGVAVIAE